jgi:hypothetical protein
MLVPQLCFQAEYMENIQASCYLEQTYNNTSEGVL